MYSYSGKIPVDIVVSGGGTGGHIYPAISIAETLKQIVPELRIAFIGNVSGPEARLIPQCGFPFHPISVSGFPRYWTWQWGRVILKLATSLVQTFKLFQKLKPKIVIGTGGYVSGPVLLDARLKQIPIILQEQNAIPGLTNRFMAHFVKVAYLGLPTARPHFPSIGIITGNPVRAEITDPPKKNDRLYHKYGLLPNLKTIFVMGGSQGATAINQMVMETMKKISGSNTFDEFQIIHQTGQRDYEIVNDFYRNQPHISALAKPYFNQIEEIYALADLLICRAGGSTLSEITAFGVPAVLVPRPSRDRHQYYNAKVLSNAQAAIIQKQSKTDPKEFLETIRNLLSDDELLLQMKSNSLRIGKPNASQEIAQSILGHIDY